VNIMNKNNCETRQGLIAKGFVAPFNERPKQAPPVIGLSVQKLWDKGFAEASRAAYNYGPARRFVDLDRLRAERGSVQ
jgi:hypothetical protein